MTPPDSALRRQLDRVLETLEARSASRESALRGLRISDLDLFNDVFEYERDEVLAYCTRSDHLVFLRPLAVVQGERIQLLNDEARRRSFPATGDVMAFQGRGYPRQPVRGELGVWRVTEHETDKANRFHLSSEKRQVYEVRPIPFSSTDYDSVREFLKEQAERPPGLQPLVFLLDDGLLVAPSPKRPDLSKDETFEFGLLSWNSLGAVRLEGRVFVIGPLPKEHGVYECAGLPSTVRKLLKPHLGGEKTAGGLTRTQLSALAQALGSSESALDRARVIRVKSELERLGQQQDALQALVAELMRHPSVTERIDQLVDQEAARRLTDKSAIQADITRLQKERGEWEERIRRQRDEHRKLRDDTSKVVKTAFDRACAAGVETLGQVSLFQAFSSPGAGATGATELPDGRFSSPVRVTARDLAPGDPDVISILKSLGIPLQRATAFAFVGEVARKAGLMLCVRGVAARPTVERWATAIAHTGVLIDSTVGLIEDSAMRNILARVPPADVLAILDANLSALDIYARPLSDLVLARLARPGHLPLPAILLALSDGVASLPLPKTFERVSVLIDLEARYVFQDVSTLEELASRAFNPDDGILYARLWRPAADRLLSEIDKLEPESRSMVFSVLGDS